MIIIALAVAIIAFFVGSKFTEDRSARKNKPRFESYQHQIDSLRFRLDTALAHIDFEYVPKERVIVKTKYKYIIEKYENETQDYLLLDTTGRVAYFRDWVKDLMRKRDPISDEGIDEPLRQ